MPDARPLRAQGDTEGGNLGVERYSAEGCSERFASLAAAVIGRNPDVIALYQPNQIPADPSI
jgi:putative ABC transport system substrate-binding protein